jgi:hypothetical protein
MAERLKDYSTMTPQLYSNAVLSAINIQTYAPLPTSHAIPWLCEHFCAPVIHPVTGESITKYKTLVNDPITTKTWAHAFGKEFRNLMQGNTTTNTPGTNAIFVMTHKQILQIPTNPTVTYTWIVVNFRPQKSVPNCVHLTASGNLINYPGELTTQTADLTTTKLLWNSVISANDAKYLCLDIKNFYLGTPLDHFEYMKMPIDIFPQAIVDQYNLRQHVKNGFIYLEIRKAIYGLPQAGILT